MIKLRNAPPTVLVTAALIAIGAIFNFVIGLTLAFVPESLQGIAEPTTDSGAPTQLLLVSGLACIAFGFVYVWVFRELFKKSQLALVVIYTLSVINILFGLFRMPIGILTISMNLLVIYLTRLPATRHWLGSN